MSWSSSSSNSSSNPFNFDEEYEKIIAPVMENLGYLKVDDSKMPSETLCEEMDVVSEKEAHSEEIQRLQSFIQQLEGTIDSQNEHMFDMLMEISLLKDKLKREAELDKILDENKDLKRENRYLKVEIAKDKNQSEIKYQKLIEAFEEKLANEQPESLRLAIDQLTIGDLKEQIAIRDQMIEKFHEEKEKKVKPVSLLDSINLLYQNKNKSKVIIDEQNVEIAQIKHELQAANEQIEIIIENNEMCRAHEASVFEEEKKKMKEEIEDLNKKIFDFAECKTVTLE